MGKNPGFRSSLFWNNPANKDESTNHRGSSVEVINPRPHLSPSHPPPPPLCILNHKKKPQNLPVCNQISKSLMPEFKMGFEVNVTSAMGRGERPQPSSAPQANRKPRGEEDAPFALGRHRHSADASHAKTTSPRSSISPSFLNLVFPFISESL